MPSLIIREASSDDVPAMFDVRGYVDENRMTRTQLAELGITESSVCARLDNDMHAWVAEDTNEIIGFSMTDNVTGCVYALFVRPTSQKRGVGKMLLDQATAWLFDRGFERIFLTTDPSTRACEFYRRRGWCDAGDSLGGDRIMELRADARRQCGSATEADGPQSGGEPGSQTRLMQAELTLRLPTEDEEHEFLCAHRATSPEVPYFVSYYTEGMPFGQYLDALADQERGINVSPNHAPSTVLFAYMGARIVGRVSIRHSLNEFLELVGGHVGYVVVPEFRRLGYATRILGQALEIARDRLGIQRILLTCDDDNIGSIRTIEKNGGILGDVITVPGLDKPKRRYWIETARQESESP